MDEITRRFIDCYNYLKFEKIVKNDTDLATKLDVSRSMVTEILKGRSNPGSKVLQKTVSIFQVNGNWLLTGSGEMMQNVGNTPTSNANVQEPLMGYYTKKPILNPGATPKKSVKSDTPNRILTPQFITVDSSGKENITYVDQHAAAGYLNGYKNQEYIKKLPSFSLPGLNDGNYRAFQVQGNSMSPTLENGDMVIGRFVEKLEYIREDFVHIVVTKNDGIVVKRLLNRINEYGYVVAKCDAVKNSNLYQNIEIYPDDILELWCAVFYGSFNFKAPAEIYTRVNNVEADLTEVLRVLKENNLIR